jgi:hypothetical protein
MMSGPYLDIAADWTQILPNHDDIDGYYETSEISLFALISHSMNLIEHFLHWSIVDNKLGFGSIYVG